MPLPEMAVRPSSTWTAPSASIPEWALPVISALSIATVYRSTIIKE